MRGKSGIWTQGPESIFLPTMLYSWLGRPTWLEWLVRAQCDWSCAQSRSLWFNLWDPQKDLHSPVTRPEYNEYNGCALEGRGFSPSRQVLRLGQYSLFKTKVHEWSLRFASVYMESITFLLGENGQKGWKACWCRLTPLSKWGFCLLFFEKWGPEVQIPTFLTVIFSGGGRWHNRWALEKCLQAGQTDICGREGEARAKRVDFHPVPTLVLTNYCRSGQVTSVSVVSFRKWKR